MAKIAFLGLGTMGEPMAGHLVRAGHEVAVWNRTRAKADRLGALGAKVCGKAVEAVSGKDFVFICVGDTPDVEQVLFGPGGAAEGAGRGTLIVDFSTISPEAEEKFAEKLAGKGIRYMDCPVTGGQKGAVEATLTFMAGGETRDLDELRPVLMAMGKRIFHAGKAGFGQRLKLVNQLVCSLHLVALSEGLAIAGKLGLDLAQARELLLSGAAKSWVIEVYGEKILKGDFAPGFLLKWQLKDARIALEAARKIGMELPGLKMATERLREADEKGLGELGSQALYRLYETSG